MIVRLKCYYPSVLKTDVLASRRISLGDLSEYGEMGRHRDNKFPKHLLLQGAHAFKRNRGMSLLFLSFSIATHIICDATEILVRDKQQERAQSFSSISRSIQSSSIYAHCLLSFDSPFCRFRRCLIDRSINLYIKATKR